MSRFQERGSPFPLLLLGLAGLGGVGLLALATAGVRASVPLAGAQGQLAVVPPPELELASQREAREPLHARAARLSRAEGPERPGRPGSASVRKEREFLEAFLTLARSEPGALEERAQALLDGAGPAPEKVALLRALAELGSAESTQWHEHAARTSPDGSGPHAVSVASYALGALARRAAREPDARQALLRLAFERPEPTPTLRRQAATALARTGDAGELELLRRALLRETDELVVLGALAALEERTDLAQARQILASFPVVAARSAPDVEE